MVKCSEPRCQSQACYGPSGSVKAIHCGTHRLAGEVNVVARKCIEPGCTIIPAYAAAMGDRPTRCKSHAPIEWIDVKNKKCESLGCKVQARSKSIDPDGNVSWHCAKHRPAEYETNNVHCHAPGCKKQPVYGREGTRPQYCREHCEPGMINVSVRRCAIPGCNGVAHYGTTKAEYCLEHRRPGHDYIGAGRCSFAGCTTQPLYGLPGGSAVKCATHKEIGMVNLRARMCDEPGCTTRASYGFAGLKPVKCATHHVLGQVNVLDRHCDYPACTHYPQWNLPGLPAKFCREHADQHGGMIDVSSSRCSFAGCTVAAGYGFPGEPRCRCSAHKEEGMVGAFILCSEAGCTKTASFMIPGERPSKCSAHRLEDMISRYPVCIVPGCGKCAKVGPLYGYANHCMSHKADHDYEDRKPKCAMCSDPRPTWTRSPDDYPSVCESCSDALDRSVWRKINFAVCVKCGSEDILNASTSMCGVCDSILKAGPNPGHKRREVEVSIALNAAGLVPTYADQALPGSESKKRPDFAFVHVGASAASASVADDNESFMLVVEVDECQHCRGPRDFYAGYACDCELVRMEQIHQEARMPTVFIRYNPDSYTDSHNAKHRWTSGRVDSLVNEVSRVLKYEALQPGLYVSYMFYDGHDDTLSSPQYYCMSIDPNKTVTCTTASI